MQYSVNGTDWKDIPGVEPFKNTRHIQVDLSDKNIKAQYVRLENQENQESWIAFREFDVDARYVRLINKTDAKKTFDIQKLSLKTFEIYEKSLVADQTTFAIGEAASNPATNLFDGDRTTQVIYQGSQNQGAKFVYDLGQTIDLKTLKVVCRDSEIDFPHHAKISVSTDGQKWTDVMTIGNQDKENEGEASNEDNINDVLPLHETSYNAKLEENINQKARFIKFEITRTKVGSDKWVRFQEFKINGGEYMPTVNDPTFESDCLDTRNGKYAYMVDADLSTAFVPAKETGTLIHFLPNDQIFSTTEFNYKTISERLRESAFLLKGIKIVLKDERTGKMDEFHFENGLEAFIDYLNTNKDVLHPTISIEGEQNGMEVDIALQFTSGYQETTLSFVNLVRTGDGGTHETGFKSGLTKTFNDYARKYGLLKEKDKNLEGNDVREGLSAIISIKVPEHYLQFEGQTKSKLGTPEARNIVDSIVYEKLSYFLEENKEIADNLVKKMIKAAQVRDAARKAREAARKGKGARQERILSGKLAPAQTKNKKKNKIS